MTLPMFPSAYPDEYFAAVIGRYHVLSGNRTERDTFHQLFDAAPFRLTHWIPNHLDAFAKNFSEHSSDFPQLLEKHTMLPLLRIFCGFDIKYEGKRNDIPRPVGRIPKRNLGNRGATQICEQCLVDDMPVYGMSFYRRSHQIPGVTVCSNHGTVLLQRCPQCQCPFDEPYKLTLSPWEPCVCGYRLGTSQTFKAKKGNKVEIKYAKFCEVLTGFQLPVVSESALVAVYWGRIFKLGFNKKTLVDRVALTAALEEYYSSELLSKMDYAYRQGLTTDWVRTGNGNGHDVHIMPMQRHLLLANFLFSDPLQFIKNIQKQLTLDEKKLLKENKNSCNEKIVDLRLNVQRVTPIKLSDPVGAVKRAELLSLLACKKNWNVQILWDKKHSLMKWLVQNDRVWFDQLLSTLDKRIALDFSGQYLTSEQQLRDEEAAKAISEKAKEFYETSLRPRKVTKSYLMASAGLNQQVLDALTYPKAAKAIKEFTESNWHFYARRLLWTLDSMDKEGMPAPSILREASGMEHKRGIKLIEYFAEHELLRTDVLRTDMIMAILDKAGLQRNWDGPQSWISFGPPVGRGYVPKSRRKVVESKQSKAKNKFLRK